ncbi:Flavonol synthase/flavanone 3-hydroxylase [Mycena indigotica]|uniref:Flavonol synthase/flavanone 3-hydroxylase n=1 Tax=Mycena indigotica TaxID=2126181 RepID=A0A8H6VYE9_9AGAR|nr:Flavonol synthase/flavanone 3-hydroxylase [Mycena indigotica]KAF7298739.1 Flavonol synthase/flavanone 3-hydroxylase [Mycena indigotica]
MPSIIRPHLATRTVPPTTKQALDWADLAVVDLSKAADPDGRAELTAQVCEAMRTQGFFYVVNHGWTPEQTARAFDIAEFAFSGVSAKDKQAYAATMKTTGSFQGYKPRQYWHIDNGINDQIDTFNINRDVTLREQPEALRPFLPELDALARHTHFDILHPILRMLAQGLELEEETFVDLHQFKSVSETYIRFMKYYPRTIEEEEKTNNVWLKGHTDIGTVTILYSQPISALQILGRDGKWRWIKHIENAMVINIGDAMEFLSGGYYKATIHRVVQPPEDQRLRERLGIFYFAMAHDDTPLIPVQKSPVLERVGTENRQGIPQDSGGSVITMEAWRKSRTSAYGQSRLTAAPGGKIEEETVQGVLVQHFN